MVHVHKYKKNQRQIISVLAVKSWKMNNSDDTVDAATQCGEETEAQWANLGPHVVKLNQYRYLMYFQPNFHVGILYEQIVQ